jgi:hypothetical protein
MRKSREGGEEREKKHVKKEMRRRRWRGKQI